MYICICQAITDRQIESAVAAGIDSVDQLRDQLGVASCCGSCEPAAAEIVESVTRSAAGAPTIYRPGAAAR